MPYTHLSAFERGQIQALLKEGKTKSEIARALGRHRSNIGRELRRNDATSATYEAARAQARYVRERQECRRTCTLEHAPLRRYVIEGMHSGWSPEQVSGRLWLDHPGEPRMRISHETIYRNAYADEKLRAILVPCLRQSRPRRRPHGARKPVRPTIPNRVSIEQRPAAVDALERYGDWEGDTIIGRHQESAIATLVERKSLLAKATVLPSRKAALVAEAVVQMLATLPQTWRRTITFDNGTEFAQHQFIAQQTGADIYFAHPYASHERARNENTNGLLREYLPKSTDFRNIDQKILDRILDELNHRPRKKLQFRTPHEVFLENLVALTV